MGPGLGAGGREKRSQDRRSQDRRSQDLLTSRYRVRYSIGMAETKVPNLVAQLTALGLALDLDTMGPAWVQAWHDTASEVGDLTVEDDSDHGPAYRLIRQDLAFSVLVEELQSSPYILGCFDADFLATVTGWPQFLIKAAQNGVQFNDIGEALIDGGFVEDLAEAYMKNDGYGHHFARYDHQTHEFTGKDGKAWYCFRTR